MSLRTLVIVALALVFGGSAAVGISRLRPPSEAPTDTVPIVVAAVDIPRGRTVSADMLRTVEWPRDRVPTGAANMPDDLVDRVCFTPLFNGEPVISAKLTPKGAGRGMGALTRPGMRSFTIPTPNIAAGVAGFILPGDRVDVLLTVTDSGTTSGPFGGGTTTVMLQNVEILAVDQRVDAPADNKVDPKDLRSVTLQVTPEQAADLALGQNKGTLQLSLRNPQDNKAVETRPATLDTLRLSRAKPWDEQVKGVIETIGKELSKMPKPEPKAEEAPKSAPPPEPFVIRTLRGREEGRAEVAGAGR
ncbi:MAG: Flp pilus assembly protein CpaB [Gemmataceae bacterium]